MKDFIMGSFQYAEGECADDVSGSPNCATIRGDLNRVFFPIGRWSVTVAGRLPGDIGHGGGEVKQRLWQIDVELIDESSHPVRHLDIFTGQVFKGAMQDGWN